MESKILEKLDSIIRAAYTSEYSDFYRAVYSRSDYVVPTGGIDASSWNDVPFTTKEDLAAYSYTDRMFKPIGRERLLDMHMSAGTSKSPVVLNIRDRLFELDLGDIKKYADRLLLVQAGVRMRRFFAKADIATIGADISEGDALFTLAARFKVQGLFVTVSQLMAITPGLSQKIDLADIKVIVLCGERFSAAAISFFREHYPNAVIFPMYGSAETAGFHAVACETLARRGGDHVHFSEEAAYPELINGADETIQEANIEGELVLTVLWEDSVFPVIRFRTGDLARRVTEVCDCGRETYEILGRSRFDRVKVPGGQIQSEELERVLTQYSDRIYDDYELHVFDRVEDGVMRPRMELRVRPRDESLDLNEIALTVSRVLRVGPEQTVHDGVERGLYAPLECTKLPQGKAADSKHTRIIKHV